jgi:murein DD-endopeptidase MepM/ murein hydrolase activator NlpD
VVAEAVTDSSGDYKLEDVKAGSYTLDLEADKRFRYMCTSPDEFRAAGDAHAISLQGSTSFNVGLMEGFLTLPFKRGTPIIVNNYFDEGGGKGMDWMNQPNGDPGHEGTDYRAQIGTVTVAGAPGVVKYVDDWGPVGIFVIISYEDYVSPTLSSLHAHLSKANVVPGQPLRRGDIVGLTGQDNTHPGPHLHYELDEGFHGSLTRSSSYTALDIYKSSWNPSYVGYWTKLSPGNDPQFSN